MLLTDTSPPGLWIAVGALLALGFFSTRPDANVKAVICGLGALAMMMEKTCFILFWSAIGVWLLSILVIIARANRDSKPLAT